MKQLGLILLLSAASFWFIACGIADSGSKISNSADPNIVVSDENNDSSINTTEKKYSDNLDKAPVPKIPMDTGQFIVTIIQTNLDLDTEDEQIVVHKISKGEDSPIIVDVVDFDSIRNKYVISWEYETKATNVRSFNLSLLDVTGDHNLEIICSGSYGNDTQTLDILQRSQQLSRYGLLKYKPIIKQI